MGAPGLLDLTVRDFCDFVYAAVVDGAMTEEQQAHRRAVDDALADDDVPSARTTQLVATDAPDRAAQIAAMSAALG